MNFPQQIHSLNRRYDKKHNENIAILFYFYSNLGTYTLK